MRALVAIAAVITGCSSVELEPTAVKVRTGPGLERPIRKIVAVRATCASLSSFNRSRPGDNTLETSETGCRDEQIEAVDQLIRSTLEFRGYAVVDSERVNAITAARTETLTRETVSSGDGIASTTTEREAVIRGSLFADAPPAIQDQILAELGAEGLLNARIFVGAPVARSPRRDVAVQVRLVAVDGGELVWASRCRVNTSWEVNEVAIMQAARCAVDRIAGSRP